MHVYVGSPFFKLTANYFRTTIVLQMLALTEE